MGIRRELVIRIQLPNMYSSRIFYVIYLFYPIYIAGVKVWIPTTNTDDKRNWNIRDIPQNCDDVSFNVNSGISLLWVFKNISLTGLTLPQSGIFTLQTKASIVFVDRAICPSFRQIAYTRNEWKGWLDPENWKSDFVESWLPHSERIPCFGEVIKFPSGKNFAVQLPPILIPVGKIIFGTEEYFGSDWADFLNSYEGKSQFIGQQSEQLPWLDEAGCPGNRKCICGKSAYALRDRVQYGVAPTLLQEAICLYAKRTCRKLDCYSPVIPEGHCCGICGEVIEVEDETENDRKLNAVKEKTIKIKTEIDDQEYLKLYVGRTISGNIQIVIFIEASNYMNNALTFASLVKAYLIDENIGTIIKSKSSGRTIASYLSKGITWVFFGTLCAVTIFFLFIYYIYVILPRKSISKIGKRNPFNFARFKNVTHEADSNENLEIGGDLMTEEASQGFLNPTFSTCVETKSNTQEQNSFSQTAGHRLGQEYNNPIYHEMQKDLEYLEEKDEIKDQENDDSVKEINL